ncbi:hypothetical protein [Cognatiyoonia sp. IB215182]|uniref:hypothetical protein n=1 Tax=Cognatiyoonia sp. IB215182 TaxID=3097353 RepID=UPI002A112D18|nr:hypothetical protein [Cognatiyoonia sp. IB215182]MDX8354452.1 hypothetical protein [Cognatiyoonia sp. IB215182]
MRAWLVAVIAVLCLPAMAQEPMNAAEFDAYVTGRTITFRTDLNPTYGVEQYLPGRRVMWSAFDGTCQYGVWFESKGDICFRYDHDPEHKCWTIFLDPDGLRGVYTTREPYTVIFEVPDRTDPLICDDLFS